MVGEQTIVIRPDGSMTFLYSDNHPALELGQATMKRASDVEWDADAQRWVINLRPPYDWIGLPYLFKNRSDAIKFEVLFLNQMMAANTTDPMLVSVIALDVYSELMLDD